MRGTSSFGCASSKSAGTANLSGRPTALTLPHSTKPGACPSLRSAYRPLPGPDDRGARQALSLGRRQDYVRIEREKTRSIEPILRCRDRSVGAGTHSPDGADADRTFGATHGAQSPPVLVVPGRSGDCPPWTEQHHRRLINDYNLSTLLGHRYTVAVTDAARRRRVRATSTRNCMWPLGRRDSGALRTSFRDI